MDEEEQFREIPEFKLYAVSNLGRVLHTRFNRIMVQSPTQYGDMTVGLTKNNAQHRRSVKRLVAAAWVDGQSLLCDSVINKDGDRTNNHYTNLGWRPRWFTWKYHQQFDQIPSWAYTGPIHDILNEQIYETILDVMMYNGELLEDIRRSISHGTRVFPTGNLYRYYK